MSILNMIKGQLRSVIQWENPDPAIFFQKWSESGDEIKDASKLIVGPGQGCIFVYEGKVQSVMSDEGVYDIRTANVPFITTITKFMQAFVSEHKVGLYFFRKTEVANCKWGTPSPLKYVDPVYKLPVGLKARGNFTFRVGDAGAFFTNFMGQRDSLSIDEIRTLIVSRLVQPMGDYMAESGIGYNQIDAQREELSSGIIAKIKSDFDAFGFTLSDFRIEGTDFDEDTKKRVNRIADVSADAMAANAAGLNYAQLQQLDAMKAAAANPGTVGMMMGMNVGQGMAQMVSGGMQQGAPAQAAASGAGAGVVADDPVAKLKKLKDMMDAGLITTQEYEEKKKAILAAM